jgi:hypothetical protein
MVNWVLLRAFGCLASAARKLAGHRYCARDQVDSQLDANGIFPTGPGCFAPRRIDLHAVRVLLLPTVATTGMYFRRAPLARFVTALPTRSRFCNSRAMSSGTITRLIKQICRLSP